MSQKDISKKILRQSSGNMTAVIDQLEHRVWLNARVAR